MVIDNKMVTSRKEVIFILLFVHRRLHKASVKIYWLGVRVMVFNATFNNISIISWQSVLLVEETRVTGEKNRPAVSH
jgi:hypothetical protein